MSTNQTSDILKSKELNQKIFEQGFVIIDFLSKSEIQDLITFFYTQDKAYNQTFTTAATNNYSYKKAVDQKLKEVFSPKISNLFNNHYAFWGNFFPKPSGSVAMPLHADLQFVDETTYASFNVWCPLVNTTHQNGAFGIVPYSHKIIHQKRGINLPRFYIKNAETIQERYGVTLPLQAGQAIVYDHRLLHFSPPNLTAENRLAATMICLPDNAEAIHYHADYEGGAITKYQINSVEDFLKMNFKEPLLTPVGQPFQESINDIDQNDFAFWSSSIETIRKTFSTSIPIVDFN